MIRSIFASNVMLSPALLSGGSTRNSPVTPSTGTFQISTSTGHESFFALDGRSPLLIPLTGEVPQWLRETRTLQSAPANTSTVRTVTTSLPEKLDAILYFDATTAAHAN